MSRLPISTSRVSSPCSSRSSYVPGAVMIAGRTARLKPLASDIANTRRLSMPAAFSWSSSARSRARSPIPSGAPRYAPYQKFAPAKRYGFPSMVKRVPSTCTKPDCIFGRACGACAAPCVAGAAATTAGCDAQPASNNANDSSKCKGRMVGPAWRQARTIVERAGRDHCQSRHSRRVFRHASRRAATVLARVTRRVRAPPPCQHPG